MCLQLNAVAIGNRLEIVARVQEAFAAAGAWILDHHAFSNLSISISFEIESSRVRRLTSELETTGVSLMAPSRSQLVVIEKEAGAVSGNLQITFVTEEQDQRDFVPAVRG